MSNVEVKSGVSNGRGEQNFVMFGEASMRWALKGREIGIADNSRAILEKSSGAEGTSVEPFVRKQGESTGDRALERERGIRQDKEEEVGEELKIFKGVAVDTV